MRLHENSTLFRQAIQATAQRMGIVEVYVEKDYWVTFALHAIFHDEIGEETVFKGGTALSKCFSIIDRFSEDIDLVVLRNEGESNYKLTKKIKAISKVVSEVLPEVELPEVTQKMGMNRKTAHTYAKEFKGDYGQVRDVIIVEATWLGCHEPYVTKEVSALVHDMMKSTTQTAMAEEYGLQPFPLKVMDPKRTICEKIMSLVRFSYSDEPIDVLGKKIRHVYDLHMLLKLPELDEFFNVDAFDEMLLKVAKDDVESYKNNNEWLEHHPSEAKLFADLNQTWDKLKLIYNGDFKRLVYGQLPKDDDAFSTLKRIKERMAKIDWPTDIIKE